MESITSPLRLQKPHLDRRSKVVNDPIHGHIELSPSSVEIIDTPQFQRLRDLKQLGVTYYVFPGASHNRFEHSLGVSYLSGILMRRFKDEQPELEVTKRDIRLVQLAGLCHDLGHGPFSHAFEGWLHRAKPDVHFHHEEMSKQMLEYLIDENSIDIDREDVQFIQELIEGQPSKKNEDRRWMYEIVANNRNSVDVDKFDYLARDCYNLGIKSSYDFSRLMKFSRVINNEICFHSKEVYNMYEMFHTRYSLFKQVYSHRVGKAIEYMVSDALLYADPYLKISERVRSPESYCYLTDSILTQIEGSTQPELKQSRDIIKRMRRRELYKMADEIIVPSHKLSTFPQVTVEGILEYKPADVDLNADDMIVDIFSCNYAKKDQNPVDHVHFFSKWDQTDSFSIAKEKVSLLIPEVFSEKYVRIYCRDPKKVEVAQEAFRTFLSKRDSSLASPQHTVPSFKRSEQSTTTSAKRKLEFTDLHSE